MTLGGNTGSREQRITSKDGNTGLTIQEGIWGTGGYTGSRDMNIQYQCRRKYEVKYYAYQPRVVLCNLLYCLFC